MRHGNGNRFRILVALLAAAVGLMAPAGTGAPPERPAEGAGGANAQAGGRKAVLATAAFASIDSVKALAAQVGAPMPAEWPKNFERQYPFIGEGGLVTDQPLGVFY